MSLGTVDLDDGIATSPVSSPAKKDENFHDENVDNFATEEYLASGHNPQLDPPVTSCATFDSAGLSSLPQIHHLLLDKYYHYESGATSYSASELSSISKSKYVSMKIGDTLKSSDPLYLSLNRVWTTGSFKDYVISEEATTLPGKANHHCKEISKLNSDRINKRNPQFHRMRFHLQEGFNILAYGYGCKRSILERFCSDLSNKPMQPEGYNKARVLVLDGSDPDFNLAKFINVLWNGYFIPAFGLLTEDLSSCSMEPDNLLDNDDAVDVDLGKDIHGDFPLSQAAYQVDKYFYFRSQGKLFLSLATMKSLLLHASKHHLSIPRLYLLIHCLDAPPLRSGQIQTYLSYLSSLLPFHSSYRIRLIASVDHYNAPLLWNSCLQQRFRWIWYELTTFIPYTTELRCIESEIMASLLAPDGGNVEIVDGVSVNEKTSFRSGVSSILLVLANLTPNARKMYSLLVEHQTATLVSAAKSKSIAEALSHQSNNNDYSPDSAEVKAADKLNNRTLRPNRARRIAISSKVMEPSSLIRNKASTPPKKSSSSIDEVPLGLSASQYYRLAREHFLVSHLMAFRSILTEFFDHKIIAVSKSSQEDKSDHGGKDDTEGSVPEEKKRGRAGQAKRHAVKNKATRESAELLYIPGANSVDFLNEIKQGIQSMS